MADKKPTREVSIENKYKTFVFKMDPIKDFRGREAEIAELNEVFHKKRMRNCILIGEAGVGKTALVKHMASVLRNEARFRELNLGSLLCDTRYRGSLETKFVNFMKSVKRENETSDRPYVMFIDEVHMILNCGASDGDKMDVSNMMKQYLTEDSFIVWGATTYREYKESIKTNPALARRFTAIALSELSDGAVIDILRDFADGAVDDKWIEYILSKSKTVKGGHQPDVSIELLDRCMSRNKVTHVDFSEEMINTIVSSMNGFANWEAMDE